MHPNTGTEGKELYECFECGARAESPATRRCASCGGELRCIGRSRDL
ncbi:MAG: rubrerythrin-like domain-containing protein [Halobacteriales archaeon]